MAANIPDGHTFVSGRGREKAIALLEAADKAGVDQNLVRTTTDGFVVPDKVAEAYEEAQAGSKKQSTKEATTEAASKATRTRKKSASE